MTNQIIYLSDVSTIMDCCFHCFIYQGIKHFNLGQKLLRKSPLCYSVRFFQINSATNLARNVGAIKSLLDILIVTFNRDSRSDC